MWLSKHLQRIEDHPGPVLLVAPVTYGTQQLMAALQETAQTPVWLELADNHHDDPVAQGNALAEAVRQALDTPLFEYSLPYQYGLKVLDLHLELLGPFTFLLSNAHIAPAFATDLLLLDRNHNRVLLNFSALPETFEPPENALILAEDDLKLSFQEAKDIAGDALSGLEVATLLEKSGGALETFYEHLHKRLNLPIPLRPSPNGPRLPEGYEVEVDPAILLNILVKQNKWLEALELSVALLPERVPEVIKEAGHVYHERGLHKRLWDLLSELPENDDSEEIIFWKLSAAYWTGQVEEMRETVEAYLELYEASELRALYAGVIASDKERGAEAKRAYETEKSALTVYQYGRILFGTNEGTDVLREAVKIAENSGRYNDITRNANALVTQLIYMGRYTEAVYWGDWALTQFDEHNLGNAQRRLLIINDWAFARILTSELTGLLEYLKEGEEQLSQAIPRIASLYRSTLGEYFLATEQPEIALTYFQDIEQVAPRIAAGQHIIGLVQALLRMGRTEEALDISRRTKALLQGESWQSKFGAELAYGMALSLHKASEGQPYLEKLYSDSQEARIPAHERAQHALYLAYAHLKLKDINEAKAVLQREQRGLAELSQTGLTLLSGPKSSFRGVWALLRGEQESLELNLLGHKEVYLDAQPVKLSPQACEILAILALNPDGLTIEQLMLLLHGETRKTRGSLKVAITTLRKQVKITQRPYRIGVAFKADFIQLQEAVAQGKLRSALELYKGPLLPDSEAPGVTEARETLEETLRQAVLLSADPDALLTLAKQTDDDLELWEATQAAMSNRDPRQAIVKAHAERIRKSWSIA